VELAALGGTCGRSCSTCGCTGEQPVEKPARLRDLRKDIARIETRISQLGRKAG